MSDLRARIIVGVSLLAVVLSTATAVMALVRDISHSRQIGALQGELSGLRDRVEDRVQLEIALRGEVQVWQAYVVDLKSAMIRAGIPVPPPPRPVTVTARGERPKITTKR